MGETVQSKVPHIWLLDIQQCAQYMDGYHQFLSVDETSKADKFRFAKDRNTYVTTRAVLRELVSKQLDCNPVDVEFTYSEYGKPKLRHNDLKFNVSHSGSYALIGLSNKIDIGVDIEEVKYTSDLRNVAHRFFSTQEFNELFMLERADIPTGFFNCWTRKESFIKAVGHGLSFPLDQFVVSLKPGDKVELKETTFDPQEKSNWTLDELPTPIGYAAAFAIREEIHTYNFFRYPGDSDKT